MTGVKEEYGTRDWVFTINNPQPERLDRLHSNSDVSYMVYQLEISDTKTQHIQGYVEFHEEKTWPEVKEIFGLTTYFSRRRGNRQSARSYCMKKESRIRGPWEVGIWQEIRENDTEKQCEYMLMSKDKRYSNRRCKNLVRDWKYCATHQKIIENGNHNRSKV